VFSRKTTTLTGVLTEICTDGLEYNTNYTMYHKDETFYPGIIITQLPRDLIYFIPVFDAINPWIDSDGCIVTEIVTCITLLYVK
jgi:hypothetical protein